MTQYSITFNRQELHLLAALVEQDVDAVNTSLQSIGKWTERLTRHVALLESTQAKLERAELLEKKVCDDWR